MRWTDQIKSAVGGRLHECTRLSANREKWRIIVRRVTTTLPHTMSHRDDYDYSGKSVTTKKTKKKVSAFSERKTGKDRWFKVIVNKAVVTTALLEELYLLRLPENAKVYGMGGECNLLNISERE
ncbi:jg16282 [Pararge aegeria aegeria]|uniref:Jg16282 protein n=1 Tax=Pararge aegeria aegeria TaxID=348720 RepID=A0A8S4RVK3_9NEOP|nr:jg16282 [Pararge aegeria aegeria]